MLDKIIFGNLSSENAHNFSAPLSEAVCGEMGQSARVALPTKPVSRFSGEYTFTLKVDPVKQNFLTVKLWSGDKYTPLFLLIDGKQLGYAKCGDYEALNLGHGEFAPCSFFYTTQVIPISFTKGKSSLSLALRHAQPYDDVTEVHGRIFEAYTHTEPWAELEGVNAAPRALPQKVYSHDDIASLSENYISKQREAFLASLSLLRSGETISITKYVESFRQFCMILHEPYCPLESDEEKGEAIELIVSCIDMYVRRYYSDVRSLAHTSHQSDWGGYYGELGQGLYILEPLIKNDCIFGLDKFFSYLDEPFDCPSREGEFSLCGTGITRKEAWERCLKANFDFASARQSYIFNQVYYTYEGAWKAMAGLGVIKSAHYIGDEKCNRILLEALGIAPWHGEHILTDKNGRELDLYHCLFHHDKAAVFTDDFLKIVCKGNAVQKTDEKGNFVRRKPYGENYFSLTHQAMPRENGYVGNYGETANYFPEWVFRTWNHGDYDLSDTILRTALRNIHSRSFMRYQATDAEGFRVMHMEQATDERNPAMHGKISYGADINDARCFLFASLKRHMEENASRYADAEWDEYKTYADEAVDFLRQQRIDGRLYDKLEKFFPNYNDFRIDRTIPYILTEKPSHVLPHTDFSLYDIGELNAPLNSSFAWADIDNLTLSLRDGDISVFAQLNLRNRAYCGVGRAHVRYKNMSHLMQFTTDASFCSNEHFIRPQNVNMDFIYDEEGSNSFFRAPSPLHEFGAVPQALCGEELPITFQKGVGRTLRENFAVDTPFSGYPDVIRAKLGPYFIVFNTTRRSYENERTFSVPVPESGSLLDMVSGKHVTAEDGFISVPPFTCFCLKLSSAASCPVPDNIKILDVLPDSESVLLRWNISAGAEKYIVTRGEDIISVTSENTFRDASVKYGASYTYSVTAVNSYCNSMPLSASCTVPSSVLDIGSGTRGFGEGDDYRAKERNIHDCILFSAKAVNKGVSVYAKVHGTGGVMLRESGNSDAVYAFLGIENGSIILRTRSKNTMYRPSGKISPFSYTFEHRGEKYLKLVSDFDLHSIIAYASSDGSEWRFLHRVVLPLSEIYYAGTAAFTDSDLSEAFISPSETDLPFPIRFAETSWEDGKCTLTITKGLDDKTLTILRSEDGINYTPVIKDLIAESFTDPCPDKAAYYKIIPYNRHGVPGEAYIIKI